VVLWALGTLGGGAVCAMLLCGLLWCLMLQQRRQRRQQDYAAEEKAVDEDLAVFAPNPVFALAAFEGTEPAGPLSASRAAAAAVDYCLSVDADPNRSRANTMEAYADMERRPPAAAYANMERRPPADMERRPPADMERRPPAAAYANMERRPPADMERRPPAAAPQQKSKLEDAAESFAQIYSTAAATPDPSKTTAMPQPSETAVKPPPSEATPEVEPNKTFTRRPATRHRSPSPPLPGNSTAESSVRWITARETRQKAQRWRRDAPRSPSPPRAKPKPQPNARLVLPRAPAREAQTVPQKPALPVSPRAFHESSPEIN